MHEKLTEEQIKILASEVMPEMRDWLINRLMSYRYTDSLEIIKLISKYFREEVIEQLED